MKIKKKEAPAGEVIDLEAQIKKEALQQRPSLPAGSKGNELMDLLNNPLIQQMIMMGMAKKQQKKEKPLSEMSINEFGNAIEGKRGVF